jgi:hypothetical protein
MRHSCSILGAAVFLVAASTSVGAQAPAGPGIFGVYNPVTGAFQPVTIQALPSTSDDAQPRATVPRSGRIRVRVFVTVKSGSPETTVPNCSMSLGHSGVERSYNEGLFLTGTRSGNNGECDALFHYSWPQASTTNPVNIGVSVSLGNRNHNQSSPPIPLPAPGALTSVVFNVTM